MDLQLIAIAAAVIIIILILLGCFVLGTRERTFEDALAEQKGLGILLSTGQHGKTAEKHKDKHKAHHDTGGGAKKKTQQKSSEATVVSGATQPKPAKKEKEEKEKLQRQRSSASASGEEKTEKEVKQKVSKETTPVAVGGSESSRSRHSSSGEAAANLEAPEVHGKKQKRQQPAKQGDEIREDTEEKSAELKSAKKAGKKKRRADNDEMDTAAPLRSSFHEDSDHALGVTENGAAEQKNQDAAATNGLDEKTDGALETVGEQVSKKGQKKKQKGAAKQQQEEEVLHQENKENVEEQFEKTTISSVTAPAPAKQKPAKVSAAAKTVNQDENNLDVIIEQLKTSTLNHTQLEFVLNALLNKQEQGAQGPKIDQIATLKKQLEEKEKALSQETQLAASVNQKLKELRQQFDAEKTRLAASERTLQEQLGGKQRDLQASQQKIQELQAQCGRMTVQSSQAQDQILHYRKALEQATNPSQLQQLREENQHLKDHLARNDQDAHTRTAELQRLRQDLAQRESQLHQSEQRFIHLQQSVSMQESNQTQQLADYQQKLAAKDLAYAQLEQELATVRREWTLLETSVRELRQQSSTASQSPAVERNVRLQSSQTVDNEEASDKLKVEIGELKASKDSLGRDLQASKTTVADLEKRIKDLDKELKEAHAASKRQTDTSQKELRQLRDELEKAQKERASLQAEHARITTSSNSNSEKIEKLEKAQAELRAQLDGEKKARASAESEINKLKSERDSTLKTLEESKKANRATQDGVEENITLKHQVQHLQSSVSSKEKDVSEWQRRSADLEGKMKSLESDLDKLKEDRRSLELKVQSLQQENAKLSEQVTLASHNGHSEGASADALKIQELSLTHLNKQLISKDGEIVQLKQQLDQQRQKNSELRERNQKVVEAMNQLEKTSKDLNQKNEAKYQKQLEDQEKETKQLLAKIIPDTKVPEKETFFEWIKEVQRVVIEKTKIVHVEKEKNITTSSMVHESHSKQFDDLKHENASLRSKISRFEVALKQTELEFKTIEDHAAKQEKMWRERVAILEKELAKAQAGHNVDLTSASSKETKEIEVKLDSFRFLLEKVEREKTTYKTDLERLRTDLETERVGARDLSSQVVKLRGMLKTGQDALKQEQDTVAQLQKQLKAFQANASASSNDAKEGKGEQQLHDELGELRNKLAQREQQLEREMMINKQLNNKLTSLGISPSPTSVGSSNGSL